MPAPTEPRWLLLIHQIPPKPDYLRVKIGRRLQALGAVAIKNSVYVLPREQVVAPPYRLTVVGMDCRRITRVRIEKIRGAETAPD